MGKTMGRARWVGGWSVLFWIRYVTLDTPLEMLVDSCGYASGILIMEGLEIQIHGHQSVDSIESHKTS